ncbi:alpha amylase C-terminal domain-containing protein [Rhodopila sp.]|uniref:alpha amylase C-terminal domain-containing protein n=1 Tax=Rhodopila sp. TaxID=2480087 RepID=UPI003D1291A9
MQTSRTGVDGSTPMGATVVPGGVTFRLWAPAARQVFVLDGGEAQATSQAGFVPAPNAAMFSIGNGFWAAFVAGAGDGEPYRFWVVGSGSTGLKRDPRARELSTAPAYPVSDCLVRDPASYAWHDGGFRLPDFRDLILYQLHIGVYYAVDAQGHDKRRAIGKFLDLLDRVDYLRDLGINGVQLLPIQEFPSETSAGYNGLDLYSPDMDYQVNDAAELARYLRKANALLARQGQPPIRIDELRPGPNQLRCVVDIFHLNGIAVLFDLVFNHAGPGFNDQCIKFLDRQPYGDDNRSLYFTNQGWVGGSVFAYWNQDVRQFLIDNVKQCFEEFHIDGIRYDEVTVIDRNGGGRFCQDLTSTARAVKPRAIQIAEYWADDRAAAVRASPAGLGFDAAWGDKLRDGVRQVIGQASGGYHAFVDIEALALAFNTPDGFERPWSVVNCIENHDIVPQGGGPRIPALADSSDARSWFARSRARLAAGLLFAGRGVPQLFMGQEILEDKPWSDDINFHAYLLIWWDGLQSDPAMRDYLAFCRDLVHLRRTMPALRSDSLHAFVGDPLDRVIAIHRWIEGSGQDVVVVANLQETNRAGYRVGLPSGGRWREIFNSDFYDALPNPHVFGNQGVVVADAGVAWNEMPSSALINLPANGFVVLVR